MVTLHAVSVEPDSAWKKVLFKGTAACSVTGQYNWHGNTEAAMNLTGGADLRYRKHKGFHYSDHRFRGELSWLRINREAWVKSNDLLRLSFLWYKNPAPGWRQAYAATLSTSFLSTWKTSTEPGSVKWYGGFMNPFTLDASWDFTRPLFSNSRLLVSFATLSVSAIPPERYTRMPAESVLSVKNTYIRSRYGCSVGLQADEKFCNKTITLDNQSMLVLNSVSRDGIRMDIQNRIAFRIYKFIQLRLDTRLVYDPLYSTQLQYRQEVLLGLFYEAGKY